MVTFLGSLSQSCCGEGGALQRNVTGVCGERSQRLTALGLPGLTCVCFPRLHCSGSWLLCRELPGAVPGLRALPRPEPLSFRFSRTQGRRLGWARVSCLPRSEQLRWPGAWWAWSPPVGGCVLSPPPSQPLGFLGVQRARLLRRAVCLFWGAYLWLRPSRRMSTIQNPKKSWLALKPTCSLVEDASSGAPDCPFRLWLPSPACLRRGVGQSVAG